jgi:hypothetical protein
MKNKHSTNWGGPRPGAGRKVQLSEEMIRITQRYTERLSEDANDPNFYIYQIFAVGDMPATEIKQVSKEEAENMIHCTRGWRTAKLDS